MNDPDLLQCPACRGGLKTSPDALSCAACEVTYPVRNGVPVLMASPPPEDERIPTTMGIDRETFRYTFQFVIMTLAVRLWIPAERRRVIGALGLKPGDRVLDHCSGLGGNLPPICTAIAPDGHVVAMDNSTAMVRQADKKVRHRQLPVIVHQADALHLPYPDGTFDAVIHAGAINQFGDGRRAAMDEILRVTRDTGVIAIMDEGMAPEMEKTRFGKFLIKQNPMFLDPIPTELIPEGADARIERVMAGLFFSIVFRKPARP